MKLSMGLPPGQEAHPLGRRLATLTLLRLAFLLAFLGILARWQLRVTHLHAFSIQIVLIALGVACALAAIYATVLRRGRHYRQLAYAQLVFDQLTWTVIVYVSGGPNSGATSLYGLTALTGALLDGLAGAAIAAAIGFCLVFGVCMLLLAGVLPVPPDQNPSQYGGTVHETAAAIAINLLVILVVTLLAGYLAERLRIAGTRLEQATQRARQAERLAHLGQIAAALAHEIRNPLGAISASIELLRDVSSLSNDDRHLCDIIQCEASRLNDLVGDMLDLTRRKSPQKSAVNLPEIAREVVHLAGQVGRGSDVRIVYDGPSDPACCIVEADPAQLRQMLWNLVRNAVQATSPNSDVLVRVHPPESNRLRFEVVDHGPGLSPDAHAHLFDAFFTTRAHGSGIGLAVVKRIAEEHGWRIEVSDEGAQTCFQVTVPHP
jgi:signal transduction histidine kinase